MESTTRWRRHRTKPGHRRPYKSRQTLLSRGELAFFRVLREVVGTEFGVSLKTRLADVLHCPTRLWRTAHGRRLAQKHVDFVVYRQDTSAILAVVELNDRTHDRPSRRERDRFLAEALASAGVALVTIRAAVCYDRFTVQRRIWLAMRVAASRVRHRRGGGYEDNHCRTDEGG